MLKILFDFFLSNKMNTIFPRAAEGERDLLLRPTSFFFIPANAFFFFLMSIKRGIARVQLNQ